MVDELEELLLRPGRGALGAQVVEDQHAGRCAPARTARRRAARCPGCRRRAGGPAGRARRRRGRAGPCSMQPLAMAAATWVLPQPLGPQQHQPAAGLAPRTHGPRPRRGAKTLLVAGVGAAARVDQVVEGQAGQRAQVAVAAAGGRSRCSSLSSSDAAAGQGLPEVGVVEAYRRAGRSRRRRREGRRRLVARQRRTRSPVSSREELARPPSSCFSISSSLRIVGSFRRPAFQDGGHVAPAALVQGGRLSKAASQPLLRVELLRLPELVGHQRREEPDVLLVQGEDAARGSAGWASGSGCQGPTFSSPPTAAIGRPAVGWRRSGSRAPAPPWARPARTARQEAGVPQLPPAASPGRPGAADRVRAVAAAQLQEARSRQSARSASAASSSRVRKRG